MHMNEYALSIAQSIYHKHLRKDRNLFEIFSFTNSLSVNSTVYTAWNIPYD